MTILLWVGQILLLFAFGFGGLMKAAQGKKLQSHPQLGKNFIWMDDFTDLQIKLIGVVEAVGGFAVLIPALLQKALFLIPWAGLGLAVVMVGAGYTHYRRGEMAQIRINLFLMLVALFVAWGQLG